MKHSIKESKEALVGVNEVALYFAKALSDGVQFKDFTEFYEALTKDEAFKSKLAAAWEGRHLVKDELKDLDLKESIELVNAQLEYLPKFIEALRKPEALTDVEAKAEDSMADVTSPVEPIG